MSDEIGAVAGDIDDLLAGNLLDDEARRRLTEIRDRLEEVATRGLAPRRKRRENLEIGDDPR